MWSLLSNRNMLRLFFVILFFSFWQDAYAALLSYRAAYTLSLASSQQGSGYSGFGATIRSAEGKLTIERRHHCDGSALIESFDVTFYEDNGESWRVQNETQGWESPLHQSYQFNVWGRQQNRLTLKRKGRAERLDDGSLDITMTDHFTAERKKTLVPQDKADTILFPIQIEKMLLALIKQDSPILTAQTFEPNIPAMTARTSLFIGRKQEKKPINTTYDVPCSQKSCLYTPISLGYYNITSNQDGVQTPFFEARYNIDETGVLWDAKLIYDKFSLNAKADSITTLKDSCPP